MNLLKEFDEINAKFGEEMSDDEMSALLERQGEVQEKLDALDAGISIHVSKWMDALRCPPPDTPESSFGRRATSCRVVSFIASEA